MRSNTFVSVNARRRTIEESDASFDRTPLDKIMVQWIKGPKRLDNGRRLEERAFISPSPMASSRPRPVLHRFAGPQLASHQHSLVGLSVVLHF